VPPPNGDGAASQLAIPKKSTLLSDVTDEQPLCFVCHCGMNIASVVDVEQVVKNIEHQPDVVFASHTMFTCSDTSLSNIKDMIREHRLNEL
jgi:heterodisulfide reductase subunit A